MKGGRNQITGFVWSFILLLLLSAVNCHGAWGSAGAVLAGGSAGAIVAQSDIPAIVSIGDAAIVEGHSGTRPMVFHVTLKTATTQTVTVSYKTAKDTALAHVDYVQTSGLLTFTPGQVHKTITIHVIGDVLFERDEIFYVTLIQAQNALIGDGIGQGAIFDDDYGLFLPVVMNQS